MEVSIAFFSLRGIVQEGKVKDCSCGPSRHSKIILIPVEEKTHQREGWLQKEEKNGEK
jgi:hypothetical protein